MAESRKISDGKSLAILIVFYSPTIFWGALVRRLKVSLWRAPVCLILRDIFPEWAVDIGLLKRGFIYRYFHKNAVSQYDNSDVIAKVQSRGRSSIFQAPFQGSGLSFAEVLYNWSHCRNLNFRAHNIEAGSGFKIKWCSSTAAILERRRTSIIYFASRPVSLSIGEFTS